MHMRSMASLQQRSPAWHAARKGKLTASNVGAALGLCPWTSRQEAYNRAMGLDRFLGKVWTEHVESPSKLMRPLLYAGNEATRWGTKNEANGILAYSAHTGNLVKATGLHTHPISSWLAGSPDGLIGTEGLLEVKCPFWKKKDGSRLHKVIPDHYYLQMNLCLECTDREWCDFISWAPEGYKIYRVWRDVDLHERLLPYYIQFFAAMQRQSIGPPPLSEEDKTTIRACVDESMSRKIEYAFWANAAYDMPIPSPEHESSCTLKRKISDLEDNDERSEHDTARDRSRVSTIQCAGVDVQPEHEVGQAPATVERQASM